MMEWNMRCHKNLCHWLTPEKGTNSARIEMNLYISGTVYASKFVCRMPFKNYFNPKYSSVPNRSACSFINFENKFPPARPYFGLHVYCFWEKNPPARLFSCMCIVICPARLLILRKKSPLHGLIWVCTFNVF